MPRPFDPSKATLGAGMSMLVVEKRSFDTSKIKLADSAQSFLREAWESTLAVIGAGAELVPYSADVIVRPDEGSVLTLTKRVVAENSVVSDLLADQDRPQVAPKGLDPNELYLYAVISDTEAGRIAMVKKQNPARRATAGKRWALADNELRVVDDSPWQLHPLFDLVIAGQGGYALRQTPLEQLLSDSPLLGENIGEWVKTVAAALPLADGQGDTLAELCRQSPRLRRRLRAINDRGHINRVSIAGLRRHAKAMGLKPADFVKASKLVVSDSNANELLQLLNEDLFVGALTGDRFRSDGKAPL